MRGFLTLLIAVLAAIGIGVGAESTFTPATYGPSVARFYAAFPAPPKSQTSTSPSASIRRMWTFTGTGTYAQLIVSALLLRWPAASQSFAVLVGFPSSRAPRIPPQRLHSTPTSIDGVPAIRVVGCLAHAPVGYARCAGSLNVSPPASGAPRTEWAADASANSAAQVEQLLASFSPNAG